MDLGAIPFDLSYPKAKAAVDAQLKDQSVNTTSRQWLVMNVVRDKETGQWAWQFNVKAMNEYLESDLILVNLTSLSSIHTNRTVHLYVVEQVPEKSHWRPFRGDTHFFGGANSGYIPYDAHEQIMESFPLARFDYISDAGHFVHMDNPSEFMMKLLPWLNKYKPLKHEEQY